MRQETTVHACVLRQHLYKGISSKAGSAQVVAIICLKYIPKIHVAVVSIDVQHQQQGSPNLRWEKKLAPVWRDGINTAVTSYRRAVRQKVTKRLRMEAGAQKTTSPIVIKHS